MIVKELTAEIQKGDLLWLRVVRYKGKVVFESKLIESDYLVGNKTTNRLIDPISFADVRISRGEVWIGRFQELNISERPVNGKNYTFVKIIVGDLVRVSNGNIITLEASKTLTHSQPKRFTGLSHQSMQTKLARALI